MSKSELKRKLRYFCDDCYTGKIFDGRLCNKTMYFNHCYCKKFLIEELGEKNGQTMQSD